METCLEMSLPLISSPHPGNKWGWKRGPLPFPFPFPGWAAFTSRPGLALPETPPLTGPHRDWSVGFAGLCLTLGLLRENPAIKPVMDQEWLLSLLLINGVPLASHIIFLSFSAPIYKLGGWLLAHRIVRITRRNACTACSTVLAHTVALKSLWPLFISIILSPND